VAGGGSSAADCIRDPREHRISVFQNLGIPETKDAIIFRIQPVGAGSITFAFGMLTAIDLNDQAKLVRNKIHNVRSDRRLATKGDAIETMRAKPIPKALFRLRHIVA
jgi:hypothetical protein